MKLVSIPCHSVEIADGKTTLRDSLGGVVAEIKTPVIDAAFLAAAANARLEFEFKPAPVD